jgi:hypothetical protein
VDPAAYQAVAIQVAWAGERADERRTCCFNRELEALRDSMSVVLANSRIARFHPAAPQGYDIDQYL